MNLYKQTYESQQTNVRISTNKQTNLNKQTYEFLQQTYESPQAKDSYVNLQTTEVDYGFAMNPYPWAVQEAFSTSYSDPIGKQSCPAQGA